jgi:hypothetical protein
MNGFLCEWFLPSQTSFVHGKNILDNFSLILVAILWVEESKQEMVALLLNCEKHMIDFFHHCNVHNVSWIVLCKKNHILL